MTTLSEAEARLAEALELRQRPVAIAFRSTPPDGVARFSGVEPSTCSFWRLAAGGTTFYTVPADHYNCPIGSYTHNVPLPPERAGELDETLGLMTELGYVAAEEVPGIPRLADTPAIIVYAPLGDMPVMPDVVIVTARPGRLMRLTEAGRRAHVPVDSPVLGRPTCMAVPAALSAGIVSSLGCIGNRIYTDVPDDELYVTIPGAQLAALVEALPTIEHANDELATYHRSRRSDLSTST